MKTGPKPKPFWSRVVAVGACWVWQGGKSRGYGYVTRDGKTLKAYRVAYELCIGPIPEGLHIDHLCRNRACVNPLHLEPVTRAENLRRGINVNREKTHCKRGHEFTEYNTRKVRGGRNCYACLLAKLRSKNKTSTTKPPRRRIKRDVDKLVHKIT